jgi:hypothetical protein
MKSLLLQKQMASFLAMTCPNLRIGGKKNAATSSLHFPLSFIHCQLIHLRQGFGGQV